MARSSTPRPPSVRRYLKFLVLVFVTSVLSLIIYVVSEHKLPYNDNGLANEKSVKKELSKNSAFLQKLQQVAVLNGSISTRKVPGFRVSKKIGVNVHQNNSSDHKKSHSVEKMQAKELYIGKDSKPDSKSVLNYNVHLFYYPWYGDIKTDGKYLHWNHKFLPHWRKEEAKKWPQGIHVPPDDIGANFYPALGPYSSADPDIVDKHMQQIQSSGAGVIVVSWYPPDQADENGKPLDTLIPLLLDSAHKYGIKVALHIEPYKDRSGQTLSQHVKYIIDSYGQHPSFYRREANGKQLPVYYLYDSYQIVSSLWAEALKPGGKHSLRGTQYDGIFLGLYLGPEDEHKLLAAGFDGFYTYFAANGFTKGSSWSNWKQIRNFAAKNDLLFVPSVGPGYVDTRVRPWNAEATRKRLQGRYFRQSFQAALDADVKLISVTSFNEWHEGSQVEPAISKTIDGFKYEDYSPGNPDFYLQLLKEYAKKFSRLTS